MKNSKKGYTPMMEKLDYRKSQGAKAPTEVQCMRRVPYASATGSIMYAVRCTRLDVAFAQNLCSRFQQNPGEIHWTAMKTILKYLRNIKDMIIEAALDGREFIIGFEMLIPSNKMAYMRCYYDNKHALAIAPGGEDGKDDSAHFAILFYEVENIGYPTV
ncbi:hypothetical protein Tco_0929765 [Tanacetum coccineum]